MQLRRIYTPEKILDESDNSDSFRDLLTQFPALLTEAQANNPLFIILDGLDHLRPAYGALNLEWLPLNLPAHVHVVVTTAEEALYRCYPELQNRLGNEKQFVQVCVFHSCSLERFQSLGRARMHAFHLKFFPWLSGWPLEGTSAPIEQIALSADMPHHCAVLVKVTHEKVVLCPPCATQLFLYRIYDSK